MSDSATYGHHDGQGARCRVDVSPCPSTTRERVAAARALLAVADTLLDDALDRLPHDSRDAEQIHEAAHEVAVAYRRLDGIPAPRAGVRASGAANGGRWRDIDVRAA